MLALFTPFYHKYKTLLVVEYQKLIEKAIVGLYKFLQKYKWHSNVSSLGEKLLARVWDFCNLGGTMIWWKAVE